METHEKTHEESCHQKWVEDRNKAIYGFEIERPE